MVVIMSNILQCKICKLFIIQEEYHECPLKDATQIGYVLINGKWYIDCVAKGKGLHVRWKIIRPIPSYMTSDESLQQYKNKKSDGDGTEPHNGFCQVCVG